MFSEVRKTDSNEIIKKENHWQERERETEKSGKGETRERLLKS